MTAELLIFYIFSTILVASALMVIVMRNTMRSALFLVLCFVVTAVLWILAQAEFLGLILVLVYVGAVMTLFLFVVMMLNLDDSPKRTGFVRYLPFAAIVTAMVAGIMFYVISGEFYHPVEFVAAKPADYSNTQALGEILYTDYVWPFELAGVLLLVAIVSAISLTFRGRRNDSKSQNVPDQLAVTKAKRLRVIEMPSEPRLDDEGESNK